MILSVFSFRVPGNFHIQMRSKHHNINPPMANLSHIVNSLSFGPGLSRKEERLINVVPENLFAPKNMNPMDSNIYINRQLHQAYHHYIKVLQYSCLSQLTFTLVMLMAS